MRVSKAGKLSSQVLRKFGLAAVPHPFLAAAVTATTSFVVSILTLWPSGKRQESLLLNRECLSFFIAAGIAVSLGMVSIYYALDLGKVTVVIPISSTGPLFALTPQRYFSPRCRTGDAENCPWRLVHHGGAPLLTLWR